MENIFLILELDFDPPESNINVINDKITQKSKFWASNFNDFKRGTEYKQYHQYIPEIKRIMEDPELRKAEAENACKLKYGQIDKHLKMLGRSGEIKDDVLSNIAKKNGVSKNIVINRAKVCGIKVSINTIDYNSLYEKYYKNKPTDAVKYDGMKTYLKPFNVDNFYDFLNVDKISNFNKLPNKILLSKAQELKKNVFNKNDNTSSAGKKNCEAAEIAFLNDTNRKNYDEYLNWMKCKLILDELKEMSNMASGEVTAQQSEVFVLQLIEYLKDRELIENIIISFCKIEKINYKDNKQEVSKNKSIICRCGAINDVSDGRKNCKYCGIELFLVCCNCMTKNEVSIKVCKCGKKLDDFDKAISLYNLASAQIDRLEIENSTDLINEANSYWKGLAEYEGLKSKIELIKTKIGKLSEELDRSIKYKHYYEAKSQYLKIRSKFPNYKRDDIENLIEVSLKNVALKLDEIKAGSSEVQILKICTEAAEFCMDYPKIKELLLKYPPSMPQNIDVECDEIRRLNYIKWTKSSSQGNILYNIIRKENVIPTSINDGEFLGKVSICEYTDENIKAGKIYFYAIYAERVGIMSLPLISKGEYNLFELNKLAIIPKNSANIIKWEDRPEGATIEILRKDEFKYNRIFESNNCNEYIDENLTNGQKYEYIIRLSYNINGNVKTSSSKNLISIPISPPKPIDDLYIKMIKKGEYEANWTNPEELSVKLYYTKTKGEYEIGDVLTDEEIKSFSSLRVTKLDKKKAIFEYNGEETIYVLITSIKDNIIIVGSCVRLVVVETVKIKSKSIASDNLFINIEYPKEATGFVVLYSFDNYPDNIYDAKASRKYIPMRQYLHDSSIVIDKIVKKNYYISIYVESKIDGEKSYSEGCNYLFINTPKQNIIYSIKVVKKLFAENQLQIKFLNDGNKNWILPQIELYSNIDEIPMSKNTGKLFCSIKRQDVEKEMIFNIPIEKKIEKNTFIKPFLKNDNEKENYQLRSDHVTNFKIS